MNFIYLTHEEYCRIELTVPLIHTGIECPRGSRPGPSGTTVAAEPYGEEATLFTRELCLQREVGINTQCTRELLLQRRYV